MGDPHGEMDRMFFIFSWPAGALEEKTKAIADGEARIDNLSAEIEESAWAS